MAKGERLNILMRIKTRLCWSEGTGEIGIIDGGSQNKNFGTQNQKYYK